MVLKLDPAVPLVWRTPRSLQFGIEHPLVTIDDVTTADERIIVALQNGVPRAVLDRIAASAGAGTAAVDAIIEALSPALVDTTATGTERHITVRIDDAGPTATRLEAHLREVDVEVLPPRSGQRPGLVVLIASHVIPPRHYAPWLRHDVPHLPVVFGDQHITVGPLVVPGESACLYCIDLGRADADPAWAAIATQLAMRPRQPETPLGSILAATAALGLLTGWRRDSASATAARSIEISPVDGGIRVRRHEPHPDCGCRALPESASVRGPSAGQGRRVPS